MGLPAFAGFPFPTEVDTSSLVPSLGLALWLDATRGLTLDGATSRVASWASRAGSAVAAQATTAAMPIASSLNGLPAVLFDGADDYLTMSNPPTAGDNLTLFVSLKLTDVTQYHGIVGCDANGGLYLQTTSAAALRADRQGSGDLVASSAGVVTASAAGLIGVTYAKGTGTNGSGALRLNRTAIASYTGLAFASFSSPSNLVGKVGGSFMQGPIAELLLYGRVLSASEVAQVESYLAAKWGTP